MSDFAKIVLATDGAQVLFYKDNDDDGAPILKQVTEMDGITAALTLHFVDDGEHDDYVKRDAAFENADVEAADRLRNLLQQALESQE